MRSHSSRLTTELVRVLEEPGQGLVEPALLVAQLEFRQLDPRPSLQQMLQLGTAARTLFARGTTLERVQALNRFLFEEVGFRGDREHYDDPRNSCLNEVLDRRLGIPISLAIVYLETARAAGLDAEGVNFPGHFLVRVPQHQEQRPALIVDPFHGGALLDESGCRRLLEQHLGEAVLFDQQLLMPASRRDILVRMVLNLKRLYVRMRSFPQARMATDLLVALAPGSLGELRDRGLLAYHMDDYTAALRDLEQYLRLFRPSAEDEDEQKEAQQLWEHVKALRRRIASFN